jgi:hypothetical protein
VPCADDRVARISSVLSTLAITNHEQGAVHRHRELAATNDLCWSMLFRLLALFLRPPATDFLHHYRAQLGLLQTQMEIVNDGLRRGDVSIEDFLVQPEE